MSKRKLMSPKKVAIYGIFIALVAALTFIAFPVTPTRGYFNFGEVVIFFIAFIIGWKEAAICGAIGASLIDLQIVAFFVPATLVAKSLEGWLSGSVIKLFREKLSPLKARVIAFSAGGSLMILTYFIYEAVVLPLNLFNDPYVSDYSGLGPALLELPFNILQAFGCGVIALMLTDAIERAYPKISSLRG